MQFETMAEVKFEIKPSAVPVKQRRNSAFIDLQKGKLMLGGGAKKKKTAANVCALVGALNKRGVARPRRSVASSVFVQDESKPTAAGPVPFLTYQIVNGSI